MLTSEQCQLLVQRALEVRQRAYAPYSNFYVGAAVLVENGRVYAGCNVENASYGLTICAERSAVCQAIAAGARTVAAIAVAAKNRVTPCGACRQVLAEFAEDLPVILVDPDDPAAMIELRLDALLPHRFQRRDRPGTDPAASPRP